MLTAVVAGVFLIIGALIAYLSQQRAASQAAQREQRRMIEEFRIQQEVAWADRQSTSLMGLQEALIEYWRSNTSLLLEREGLVVYGGSSAAMEGAQHRADTISYQIEDQDLGEQVRVLRRDIGDKMHRMIELEIREERDLEELDERVTALVAELSDTARAIQGDLRQRLTDQRDAVSSGPAEGWPRSVVARWTSRLNFGKLIRR